MFLKPAEGSVRAVSSPTPFMLNGVKVWSSAPIHIYDAGGSRTIQVEPLDALGAEFVRGWHKLPDELKVRVLEFNVTAQSPISYYASIANNGCDVGNLWHHLKATPEIAGLSRDIYYTRNTFLLRDHSCTFTGWPYQADARYLAYPPRSLNVLIRSITLEYGSTEISLTHVRRLASGACGFENLRYVKILILVYLTRAPNAAMIEDGQRKPVRFCEGGIKSRSMDDDETSEARQKRKQLLASLKSIFVFGCSKDKRGVIATMEAEGE
jgi:hypothetical protein